MHGLACHPRRHVFAVTGYSGMLHVWNYLERSLVKLRQFEKLLGQCLTYDPKGQILALGCTNGTLKLLNADTLEDIQTFKQAADCITLLEFSPDSLWIACADADMCISLFHYTNKNEDPTKPVEWVYVGKFRGHWKTVTALVFCPPADEESELRLFSIGEDRVMQEYDLLNSHITTGLVILETTKIEQTALPTAAFLLAPREASAVVASAGGNDVLVIANDQYKFKTRDIVTKQVKQTLLGPTFGGPMTKAAPFSGEGGNRYLAYATRERVVGIVKLPLDGNPNRTMGMIAHPDEISDMAVSYDGKWLFTAGGEDYTVNMWDVDTAPLEYIFKTIFFHEKFA